VTDHTVVEHGGEGRDGDSLVSWVEYGDHDIDDGNNVSGRESLVQDQILMLIMMYMFLSS
jgi:hypothetical protein